MPEIGAVAGLVLMLRGPAAGSALVATALTIVGNVLFTSMFAAAAYAQPAIGRAFLDGVPGAEGLYDDVYGTPLLVAFALGSVTFVGGALLLGRALARTSPSLRWAGWTYGALYHTNHDRDAALDGWLYHYNHHRRHSAIGRQAPISRLNNLLGSYS